MPQPAAKPASICRTRAVQKPHGKFYTFDVQTDRGDCRPGFACPGFATRAEAVAKGKKWRTLFEREDYQSPKWEQDYKKLFKQTEAAMSPEFTKGRPT